MGGREREQGGERNGVNRGEDGPDHHERSAAPRVPLYRMFAFADRTDAALMAVGAATAVANGMAQPLMTFIFGDVIDAFGSAASSRDVLHRVTKVRACVRMRDRIFSCLYDTNLRASEEGVGESKVLRRFDSIQQLQFP